MVLLGKITTTIFLSLVGMSVMINEAWTAESHNKDWPCVQRKVPELSLATMWSGPEISETEHRWREHDEISQLVKMLSRRRLSLDEAQKKIDKYAKAWTGEKSKNITLLFAGLFQTINDERRIIIKGIEKYSKKQQELAERIKRTGEELNRLSAKDELSEEDNKKLDKTERQLNWDTRIFDERETSLQYVCESPVLLGQRLFALGRKLQEHLQ